MKNIVATNVDSKKTTTRKVPVTIKSLNSHGTISRAKLKKDIEEMRSGTVRPTKMSAVKKRTVRIKTLPRASRTPPVIFARPAVKKMLKSTKAKI